MSDLIAHIAVVYHSGFGHTRKQAQSVVRGAASVDEANVHEFEVEKLDAASWTFECAARRVYDVAAFADGRMNPELELLGHGDLDLRVFPRRPKNADALNATFRTDNRQLLLAGVLAGLREIGVFR